MSRGRKTKGGLHYSEEERRRLAQLSVTRGTAAVARENGISEASIKAWRKAFGVQGNDDPWGGTMDRHYCRRCVHGCAMQGSFTGCMHLLDTGEKRPYTPDGWCLGFTPRQGVHQSTVDAYRRMCARHIKDDDGGDNDNDEDGMDMQGKKIEDEKKREIYAYYTEHGWSAAQKEYGISKSALFNIKKAYGGKAEEQTDAPVYKKLTAEDIPEVAEPEDISAEDMPELVEDISEQMPAIFCGSLEAHIRQLLAEAEDDMEECRRSIGRYKRMLAILEEEA